MAGWLPVSGPAVREGMWQRKLYSPWQSRGRERGETGRKVRREGEKGEKERENMGLLAFFSFLCSI